MSDVTVRAARPDDRPQLVVFMAALQDHERAVEPNRRPGAAMADGHLAALEDWSAASGGGVLVAEAAGRVAGFIVFGIEEEFGCYVAEPDQRRGAISDLWVEPGARDGGTGAALIAAAERRLAEAGIRRAEITLLASNAPAARLYSRLGYAPYQVTLAKAL